MKNFWIGRHKRKEAAKKEDTIKNIIKSVLYKRIGLGISGRGIRPKSKP